MPVKNRDGAIHEGHEGHKSGWRDPRRARRAQIGMARSTKGTKDTFIGVCSTFVPFVDSAQDGSDVVNPREVGHDE
jgi:hypothetical protein